jgi:hypothetical protein
VLCTVVAHGGVSECLVGGGTIRSHSPAVNSKPDAARMCRRDKRCAWRLLWPGRQPFVWGGVTGTGDYNAQVRSHVVLSITARRA